MSIKGVSEINIETIKGFLSDGILPSSKLKEAHTSSDEKENKGVFTNRISEIDSISSFLFQTGYGGLAVALERKNDTLYETACITNKEKIAKIQSEKKELLDSLKLTKGKLLEEKNEIDNQLEKFKNSEKEEDSKEKKILLERRKVITQQVSKLAQQISTTPNSSYEELSVFQEDPQFIETLSKRAHASAIFVFNTTNEQLLTKNEDEETYEMIKSKNITHVILPRQLEEHISGALFHFVDSVQVKTSFIASKDKEMDVTIDAPDYPSELRKIAQEKDISEKNPMWTHVTRLKTEEELDT